MNRDAFFTSMQTGEALRGEFQRDEISLGLRCNYLLNIHLLAGAGSQALADIDSGIAEGDGW